MAQVPPVHLKVKASTEDGKAEKGGAWDLGNTSELPCRPHLASLKPSFSFHIWVWGSATGTFIQTPNHTLSKLSETLNTESV